MRPPCEVCGRPSRYRHHPTGRGEHGRYLDPDLELPMCHDDHYLTHDDWHTQAIEEVEGPLTYFERVQIRLRRLATGCARMDEARGGETYWGALARVFARWAEEIAKAIRRLDQRDPSWRQDDGFYPERGER